MLDIVIKKKALKVAIKGKDAIVNGDLCKVRSGQSYTNSKRQTG
jgi:hypothetical protein